MKFFQKFFGKGTQSQDWPPKQSEKRPQKAANGALPQGHAQEQHRIHPDTQVAAADAKAQIDPGGAQAQQKTAVGQDGVGRAQRPQETVHQPQHRPKQQRLGQSCAHPNRRRSRPPPVWGSS